MASLINTLTTDNAIRAAAIECHGCADASVVRYTARHGHTRQSNGQSDGTWADLNSGAWFVLSIQREQGGEWEVVARRRTKAELWEFVQNRTYKVSARPVGAIPGASGGCHRDSRRRNETT
jgi:hypothetical protein